MKTLNLQKLGKRIKGLREAGSLTQSALAGICGVSLNQLGRIERGAANPTLATIAALSGELGVPLHELLKNVHTGKVTSRERVSHRARLLEEITDIVESQDVEKLQLFHKIASLIE